MKANRGRGESASDSEPCTNAALHEVLETYDGLSGVIELDEAGDRIGGSYNLYSIQNVGGGFQWVLVDDG